MSYHRHCWSLHIHNNIIWHADTLTACWWQRLYQPECHLHTHTHTLTHPHGVLLKHRLNYRVVAVTAVVSLKIHSCRLVLFRPHSSAQSSYPPPSPPTSSVHNQTHLSPALPAERLCDRVSRYSSEGFLLHKWNVLGPSDLPAPTEPSVKHLGRALLRRPSQSGAPAVNDIS